MAEAESSIEGVKAQRISSRKVIGAFAITLFGIAIFIPLDYTPTVSPASVGKTASVFFTFDLWHRATCTIGTPPAGTDPFYKKYCVVMGIPIMSSGAVSDRALKEAGILLAQIIKNRVDLRNRLMDHKLNVAIVGRNEKITDIPEYKDFPMLFPDVDYSTARGLGATTEHPTMAASEENLLCEPSWELDHWTGESIFIHEFAHSVMNLALEPYGPTFTSQLNQSYDAAKSKGLWQNTFAISHIDEYWAEGVQSYFNANQAADPPDGIHNSVDIRSELKSYDPTLYNILARTFPTIWVWNGCTAQ